MNIKNLARFEDVNLNTVPAELFTTLFTREEKKDKDLCVFKTSYVIRGRRINVHFSYGVPDLYISEGVAVMACRAARQRGWRHVFVEPTFINGQAQSDRLSFVNADVRKNRAIGACWLTLNTLDCPSVPVKYLADMYAKGLQDKGTFPKLMKMITEVGGYRLESKPMGVLHALAVFDKGTDNLVAVIQGGASAMVIRDGKYMTKGAIGLFYFHHRVHDFRKATPEEVKETFTAGFYDSRKDHPFISMAKYSNANGELISVSLAEATDKMVEIHNRMKELDDGGADDTRFALAP